MTEIVKYGNIKIPQLIKNNIVLVLIKKERGCQMMLKKAKESFMKGKSGRESDIAAKIAKRAYELYEKRGYSHGSDWSDWFEAERQIRREMRLR